MLLNPFKGLSDESINQSLLKIGTRAFASVPFQFLLFGVMTYCYMDLGADPNIWFFGALLVFNSCIRYGLWKFGPWLLTLRNGQAYYRSTFAFSAFCIGGVWGGTNAYSFYINGITLQSMFVFCANLGAAATFLPMAAFDVGIAYGFLFWTTMLPATVLLVHVGGGDAYGMALGFAMYAFLMSVLAKSMHNTQIQLLQSYEKLQKQERELKVTHTSLVESHNLINGMLESIDQAFLLFNEQGVCTNAPSQKSKDLLGIDPTNKHLCEILPAEAHRKDDMTSWFKLLFLDRLEFSQVICQGPSRATVPATGGILKLNYHPLRDENGKLSSVIFTGSDVTKEIKAKRTAEANRERAEMILRIIGHKASFLPFLTEVEATISHLIHWNGADLDKIRRELHTIKGGAMLFGSSTLAKYIYDSELEILNCQPSERQSFVNCLGERLKTQFAAWQSEQSQLFTQLGVYDSAKVEISRRKIEKLEKQWSAPSAKNKEMQDLLSELLSTELGELLQNFEAHVQATATKLGKTVHFKVHPSGGPLQVPPNFHHEVMRTLVHLFNNAVDHGLESPIHRRAANKPEQGSLFVSYKSVSIENKNWIEIRVGDDGGGINISKLRAKLIQRGEVGAAQASDLEIAMRVFDGAMSTKDTVTELSGQGIGMAAVRASVVNSGGRIRVVSTSSLGTEFEILLPWVANRNQKHAA